MWNHDAYLRNVTIIGKRGRAAVDHESAGGVAWHEGRQCDGGSCVEIAVTGGEVLLRSTASPAVLLALSRAEWHDFLADAKEGLFDQL
jgi:hypothetical protein